MGGNYEKSMYNQLMEVMTRLDSNFPLAMKICFDFLRGVTPRNIENLISKYILHVRLGKNYALQHRVQNPTSFSYRFV